LNQDHRIEISALTLLTLADNQLGKDFNFEKNRGY